MDRKTVKKYISSDTVHTGKKRKRNGKLDFFKDYIERRMMENQVIKLGKAPCRNCIRLSKGQTHIKRLNAAF